jgi:hypothetical protein
MTTKDDSSTKGTKYADDNDVEPVPRILEVLKSVRQKLYDDLRDKYAETQCIDRGESELCIGTQVPSTIKKLPLPRQLIKSNFSSTYSIGSKSAAPCLHSGQTMSSGSSSPS